MITLEYLNTLKHIANNTHSDGDGNGQMLDMLQALIPALPPMVAGIVSEFIATISEPDININLPEE